MDSPLIGLALFGVIFVGIVVLWQGATGGDRDMLGFGAISNLFGSERRYDQDAIDRMHPPEQHPRRLMAIGAGLIVVGILGIVIWGALTG